MTAVSFSETPPTGTLLFVPPVLVSQGRIEAPEANTCGHKCDEAHGDID